MVLNQEGYCCTTHKYMPLNETNHKLQYNNVMIKE